MYQSYTSERSESDLSVSLWYSLHWRLTRFSAWAKGEIPVHTKKNLDCSASNTTLSYRAVCHQEKRAMVSKALLLITTQRYCPSDDVEVGASLLHLVGLCAPSRLGGPRRCHGG